MTGDQALAVINILKRHIVGRKCAVGFCYNVAVEVIPNGGHGVCARCSDRLKSLPFTFSADQLGDCVVDFSSMITQAIILGMLIPSKSPKPRHCPRCGVVERKLRPYEPKRWQPEARYCITCALAINQAEVAWWESLGTKFLGPSPRSTKRAYRTEGVYDEKK